MNGLMTKTIIKRLFSNANHYLIVSFFDLPPTDPKRTDVFPAIVNRMITEQQPTEGDHVLVYQTSPTFHRLFPLLETMDSRFIIYGFGKRPSRKNLEFKGRSKEGFINDLASCRYVIANGGHNVISEALYLGKPVFSFPIASHYEQFVNARFLGELGYGYHCTDINTAVEVLELFETRLDKFRSCIKKNFVLGNKMLIRKLKTLMEKG